ncbi:MAG: hypothetical protein IIC67_09035, partial [Thaumarchaeota archaeon]|nr:hypothetical protein [Nitrososphaerota archaeon]
VAVGDSTITVANAGELTNPSILDSKDLFPITIRIDPDAAKEDIIISSISGNILTVQPNLLNHSEDFTVSLNGWTPTGMVITEHVSTGPFGGDVADKLEFGIIGNNLSQDSEILNDGLEWVFSVWLKATSTDTEGTIGIRVEDGVGVGSQLAAAITTKWQRFEVSRDFITGTGNTFVKIIRSSGNEIEVFAFGAQLELASTRGFYAATKTNKGTFAGRGAFGSTVSTHLDGAIFKEAICYRGQITEEGVHPTVISRDLFNRGEIKTVDIDIDGFNVEFNFSPGYQLRRGRSSTQADSTIIKARNLLQHLVEVREQSLLDIWVDLNGIFKSRWSWRALNIGEVIGTTLTDENNIIEDSLTIKGNKETRVTKMFIYFNMVNGVDGKKREDFVSVVARENVTPKAISGPKAKIIFGNWLFRVNEPNTIGGRTISRFLRGARIVQCMTEIKDDTDIELGGLLNLDTENILSVADDGVTAIRKSKVYSVMQKDDITPEGKIPIMLMEGRTGRFGNISPAGTPVFTGASDQEKLKFAWIGTAAPANKVGSPPEERYLIQ